MRFIFSLLIISGIAALVFFGYKEYEKSNAEFPLIISKVEESKEDIYRLNQEIERIRQEIKNVNERFILVKNDLEETDKTLRKIRLFDFLHRDEKNKARELVKEAKQDLNLIKRGLVTLAVK